MTVSVFELLSSSLIVFHSNNNNNTGVLTLAITRKTSPDLMSEELVIMDLVRLVIVIRALAKGKGYSVH